MPVPGDARTQRGFSRLEFAVVVAVFGVFAGVLLERFQYYQEYAEKTAMEMTIANIRAGLRLRVANLLMADRVSEIAALTDDNPIDWLERKPENYLGEFDGAPPEEPRGKWYFDRRHGELVYTASSRRHFSPAGQADFTVHYRAVRMPAGKQDVALRDTRQQWVAILPANEYRWFQ